MRLTCSRQTSLNVNVSDLQFAFRTSPRPTGRGICKRREVCMQPATMGLELDGYLVPCKPFWTVGESWAFPSPPEDGFCCYGNSKRWPQGTGHEEASSWEGGRDVSKPGAPAPPTSGGDCLSEKASQTVFSRIQESTGSRWVSSGSPKTSLYAKPTSPDSNAHAHFFIPDINNNCAWGTLTSDDDVRPSVNDNEVDTSDVTDDEDIDNISMEITKSLLRAHMPSPMRRKNTDVHPRRLYRPRNQPTAHGEGEGTSSPVRSTESYPGSLGLKPTSSSDKLNLMASSPHTDSFPIDGAETSKPRSGKKKRKVTFADDHGKDLETRVHYEATGWGDLWTIHEGAEDADNSWGLHGAVARNLTNWRMETGKMIGHRNLTLAFTEMAGSESRRDYCGGDVTNQQVPADVLLDATSCNVSETGSCHGVTDNRSDVLRPAQARLCACAKCASVLSGPKTGGIHPDQTVRFSGASFDAASGSLKCQIAVRNMCFRKEVFIRVTTDDWLTQRDVRATFTESADLDTVSGISKMDYFTADVDMHCDDGAPVTVTQMAVCYRADGQEFWDNNEDNNYAVQMFHR